MLHYYTRFFLFSGQTFPKKGQRVVVHYVGECGGWTDAEAKLLNGAEKLDVFV